MGDQDAGDGDPYIGQIESRNGCLKMYCKPKSRDDGYWVELSNFSMSPRHHSVNKVAGHGEYIIFHCEVQGGGEFFVPLTNCHLDSSSKACAAIDEYKQPVGGRLDLDRVGAGIGKAKLHHFLISQIKKYKNSSNQLPAIVSSTTGFVNVEWKWNGNELKAKGYILGPEQVIPATQADAMAISLLSKVWIGGKKANNYVLPQSVTHITHAKQQDFINSLFNYHGCNKASVLAAIGYMHLTLHKKDLVGEGIKLGVMHLLGPQSAGKSTLGIHMQHILPRQKTESGTIKIKKEDLLSVHLLFQTVTQEKWCVIQDPPTEDPKMNFFLDSYYEDKIAKTGASSKKACGDSPSCGLLFIWPHEAACLEAASATSLTKGFYIVHKRNTDWSYEEFAKLDKAWREESASGPAIFNTLLHKIDLTELGKKTEELMVVYHNHLIEAGYSKEALNEAQRLVHQYSLIEAAVVQWREATGFIVPILDLQSLFTDVCIPYMLDLLKRKKSGRSQDAIEGAPEEQLISNLKSLSSKALLNNVGFFQENAEPHVGFSLSLAGKSKAVETYLTSISIRKSIKPVLSPDSEELWFRRKADGHVYGLSKRIMLYMCPISALTEGIKEFLKSQLESILPEECDLDMSGNVKAQLDDIFGKFYGSDNQTSKRELMNMVGKLNQEEAKQTKKFISKLIKKRRHEALTSSSSSESESNESDHESEENPANEPEVDEKGENSQDDEKETETEADTDNQDDVTTSPNKGPSESSPAMVKTRSRAKRKKKE